MASTCPYDTNFILYIISGVGNCASSVTLCRQAKGIFINDCTLSMSFLRRLGEQLNGCRQLHTLQLVGVETVMPDGSVVHDLPDELVTAISTLHSIIRLELHSVWPGYPRKHHALSPGKCEILCKGFLYLSNIQTLDLSSCPIGGHGTYITQAINDWPHESQLRKLNLEHCEMPSTVTGGLMQALATRCHKLEDINLIDNDLGGQVAALLSQTHRVLEHLPLWMCNLQPDDCHALAVAIQQHRLPKVKMLDFNDNKSLTEEAEIAVLSASLTHLQGDLNFYLNYCKLSMAPLDLDKCKLTSMVKTGLPETLVSGCNRLTSIDIVDYEFSGKTSILTSQTYTVLTRLTFIECNLQPADGYAIATAIKQHRLPLLEELVFQALSFDDEDIAAALCKALFQHRNLKWVLVIKQLVKQYTWIDSCVSMEKGVLNLVNDGLSSTIKGALKALTSRNHGLVVKELKLNNNDLGGQLKNLTSKIHALLRKLELRKCNLVPADGYAIATAIQNGNLPKLEELDVLENPLMDKEAEAAILGAALNHCQKNQKIQLQHFCYDILLSERKVSLALCKASGLSNALSIRRSSLEELILRKIDLGGKLAAMISHNYFLLGSMHLITCNLHAADCKALASAVGQNRLPKLEELSVSDNDLSGKVKILFSVTYLELRKLELCWCHLQPADVQALGVALQDNRLPKVEKLRLDVNNLEGQIAALTSQPLTGLKHLSLGGCHLNLADGRALSVAIEKNRLPQVQVLDLGNNPSLGEEGVAAILNASLTHHQMELWVNLLGCDRSYWLNLCLSDQFVKEWEQKCHDTHVKPSFHHYIM